MMATSISNIPQVTPFKLQQEMQRLRDQNQVDRYGLTKVIGSIGDSWDAMQKTMSNTMSLQDKEAQLNAKLDSGFYPAQAANQVAGFNAGEFDSIQKLGMEKDIQSAFQRAKAEGKQPGTPEFTMAMQSYISHPRANEAMKKTFMEAQGQLGDRAVQTAYLKQAVENVVMGKIAENFFEENKAAYTSLAVAQGHDPKLVLQQLRQESKRRAMEERMKLGIQASVDPFTGAITVKDDQGREVPLDPQMLATVFGMGGNSKAFKALQDLTRVQTTAEQAAVRTAIANKAPAPKAPGKPVPTRLQEMEAAYNKLEIEYFKALGKPGVDAGPMKTVLDAKKKEIDAEKQRVPGATGAAPANTAARADQFSGTPAGTPAATPSTALDRTPRREVPPGEVPAPMSPEESYGLAGIIDSDETAIEEDLDEAINPYGVVFP
jgi:hypothetical protein